MYSSRLLAHTCRKAVKLHDNWCIHQCEQCAPKHIVAAGSIGIDQNVQYKWDNRTFERHNRQDNACAISS